MSKLTIRWLAAAAAAVLCLAQGPAQADETAAPKQYNNRYFQFDYPAGASLTASRDGDSVQLDISTDSALWFSIDAPSSDDYPDCARGDAFASCYIQERAKGHCNGDSSEGTQYCLDADVRKERVTIGGKTGYRFHLTRTQEVYDAGTKSKYEDPQLLYFFEVSAGAPKHRGWQTAADRAGPHLLILEISGTNDDASRKVLDTLQFH